MRDRAIDFQRAHPELEDHWFDLDCPDRVEDPIAIGKIICVYFNWPLQQTTRGRVDGGLLHQAQRMAKRT